MTLVLCLRQRIIPCIIPCIIFHFERRAILVKYSGVLFAFLEKLPDTKTIKGAFRSYLIILILFLFKFNLFHAVEHVNDKRLLIRQYSCQ